MSFLEEVTGAAPAPPSTDEATAAAENVGSFVGDKRQLSDDQILLILRKQRDELARTGDPGSSTNALEREISRVERRLARTQDTITAAQPSFLSDVTGGEARARPSASFLAEITGAGPEGERMPPAQPPVRDIITGEMMWGEPGPRASWLEVMQQTAPQLAAGLNQFRENLRKWQADAGIERSYEAVEKLKNPRLSEGARRTAEYDVSRLKARIEKSAQADKGIAQNAIDVGLVTPDNLDVAQQGYLALVQSSPPMLLGTAAAVVTKNPVVAWMLMGGGGGAMQGASTYVEAKQKTGSFHAANVSGLIDAGLEIFGETLPVYAAFQKGLPGLNKLLKVIGAEAGEEVATQFMQDIHKWALYDRSITWPEMVRNMEIAGIAGAGGGAIFGGAVALTERGAPPGAGATGEPSPGGPPEAPTEPPAAPPAPTDMTHQLADGTPVKPHVEDGKPIPGLWETSTGELVEAGRAEPNTIEPNAVWKTGGTEYEVEVTGKGQADGTARLADGQEIPIAALQLDEDAKVLLGLAEPKKPAAPAGGETAPPPPRGPAAPAEAAGPPSPSQATLGTQKVYQPIEWRMPIPAGTRPNWEKRPSEKLDQYRARMKARAEQKKQINTNTDSITDAIIKLGGISRTLRMDILGDDKEQKHIPFVGYLFATNGTELDDLATRLQERGYLTQADIDNPNDNGGMRLLAERIKEEMAGRETFYSGFRTVAAGAEDLRRQAEIEADLDADRQLYSKAAALEEGLNREPGLNISPEEIAADGLTPTPERLAIIDLMRELPENIQERVAIANAEASEVELLAAVKEALKEVQRGTERVSRGAEAARPGAAPEAAVEPKGRPAGEPAAERPAGQAERPAGGAVGPEAGPEVKPKQVPPFALAPRLAFTGEFYKPVGSHAHLVKANGRWYFVNRDIRDFAQMQRVFDMMKEQGVRPKRVGRPEVLRAAEAEHGATMKAFMSLPRLPEGRFALGPKDVHWQEYLDFWAADILGRRAMVWKPSTEPRSTRKHYAAIVAGSGTQLRNKGIADTLEEAKKIAEEGAALRPAVAPNQKFGRRPAPGKFALTSRYHITAQQEAREWLERLMERHGEKWLPAAEKAVADLEETLAERPAPNVHEPGYTPAVWEMRRSQELATQMRYAIGQQRRQEGVAKLPPRVAQTEPDYAQEKRDESLAQMREGKDVVEVDAKTIEYLKSARAVGIRHEPKKKGLLPTANPVKWRAGLWVNTSNQYHYDLTLATMERVKELPPSQVKDAVFRSRGRIYTMTGEEAHALNIAGVSPRGVTFKGGSEFDQAGAAQRVEAKRAARVAAAEAEAAKLPPGVGPEEKAAAIRDRDVAVLTPPEGTAPPREAKAAPTQQAGLFAPGELPIEKKEKLKAKGAPGQLDLFDSVDDAAAQTAKKPTEAQQEAENYRVGKFQYEGITTSIETAAGQKRRPEWPALKDNYGRILGTVGFDKDHLDIFWKPGTTAAWRGPLYVVNQYIGGKFDEHKVMGGYGSLDEARQAYLRNYEKGWDGLDSIIPISLDAFKSWAYDSSAHGPKGGKLRLAEARRREVSAPGGAAALQAGAPSARDVLGIATLPRGQARNTVDEVKAQFRAHPIATALGDKVSVIQGPLDLPPHVLREAIGSGVRLSQIRGYWDPVQGGQIYVVAGTIPRGEAGTILLHEAVGHYGVAQVLGEEGGRAYNAALQEIYDARRPEIAREVRSGFLNAYNLDLRNAEHQRTAASEYIAHMAETGAEPTLWQKFVATVKRLLRGIGLTRDWTDGDILHLLQLSRSSLINGGGATYNGMAAYDQFGSSLSLGLSDEQEAARAGPRYVALARRVAALELKVDRAFARGQKNAEDLDAQLAELREQLTSLAADVTEGEGQEFDYSTFPEHAANLYHQYLAGTFSREDLNHHLGEAQKQFTGGVANYTPATDEQLFAAAKDAYQAYMDRIQMRRGKFALGGPRGLNEIYGIRDGRVLGVARRSYTGQGVWQVYLANGTNENLFARGAFRRLQAGSIGEVRRIFNREGLEFRAIKPRNVPVPDSSIFDLDWVAPKLNAELRQPSTWLRYTIRYFQNRLLLPELYERTITREVGKIPEQAKAHREARLAHQRSAGLIADFDHDHTEPIIEAMKRDRLSLKDVGLYLYAKVAPEVNAYVRTISPENVSGSGMSDERAAAVLEAFRAFDKAAPLERISTMVRRIVYEREQRMIDKGLVPTESVLATRERYPNYVPLRDMMEDQYIQAEIGSGYRVGRQMSPRFGRFTEAQAEFILPAVIAQAKGTIAAGENAEVLRAFLRLVEFAPNPAAFEIERGVFKQTIDKDTGLTTWTPRPSQMVDRTHLIPVPVEGDIVLIRVADEELAKAFNTSGVPVPEALQMLGTVTRFYSVMATGAYPEFPPINFLRDVQQAGIRLSGEQTLELAARMTRDAPAAFWGAFSGLRAKGQYVRGLSAKFGAENWHAWYRRYIEAGGHIAYRGMQDVETQHKDFLLKLAEAGVFPEGAGTLTKGRLRMHRVGRLIGAKQLAQFVIDLNGAIENSIRLATFKNAVQMGFNDKDAAFMARNVSVDFNLKGEAGALIGSLWMFFNANIQDVALLFRSLINHPKIRIAALALFFMGMLLDWWNRQWAEKTKDGRNYYDNISRSIKQRNWVIMGPDRQNAVLIPIPFGFGIFPIAGENLMAALPASAGGAGKPALEAAGDTFVATINALSPFGNVPESWLGALQIISPTPSDPAVQAMTNRNFSDKAIVPERPKGAAPQAKASTYFSGTPEPYVNIAQWLNAATGGNEVRSGFADISPNMLEHWVRSIFGSTGGFWARVAEGVGQKLSGKEIEVRNMPFVRRFYYEPKDYELSRRFYENVNQAEVAQVEVQNRVRAGDAPGAAALRHEFQGERKLFGEAMDSERQVAQHRQNIAAIKRNPRMSDEQKKLLIEREEGQSRETMMRFNLRFDQVVR